MALALPLDLCASFVLLGVAQNRIHMQFSWVVANLVMSFSVSTIPLVFGHKLPRGTPGAGSMPQLEQEGRYWMALCCLWILTFILLPWESMPGRIVPCSKRGLQGGVYEPCAPLAPHASLNY